MASNIDAFDRIGYLFGTPIKHSLSGLLHQTTFDALQLNWSQFPFESGNIDEFMRLVENGKVYGAAVTMPNKIRIIPRLDELTPECRDVGACNTIFLKQRNGKRILCGTNTDVVGIREGILQNVLPELASCIQGRPGMIIGGGGTSRAAVYTMKKWLKCSTIYLVNRDDGEVNAVIAECTARGFGDGLMHVSSEAQAASLAGPAVIVSAIPNYSPSTPAEHRTRTIIRTMLRKEQKGVLLEMCYHPTSETEITDIARAERWQVIPGVEAMIWQGLEQSKIWTGKPIAELPVEKVKAAIAKALEPAAKL